MLNIRNTSDTNFGKGDHSPVYPVTHSRFTRHNN